MNILLNEAPNISYFVNQNEHQDEIDQGYAASIEVSGKKSVLVFQNVDDHRDGNGLALLWLIKGQGRFYSDGEPIEMKTGDVLIFNDNIEHGFESDELCMAVNILLEKEYNLDEVKALIREVNTTQKRIKP
jgi:hypothetical protein